MGTDHASDANLSTRTSLLLRVRNQDAEAWRRLTRLYGPLVFHWCRRLGLNPDQAADVFQEAFASVARGIARFDPGRSQGSFRGWLWTVTRHKVLDLQRRSAHLPDGVGGSSNQKRLAELPDPFTDESHDELDRNESASLVHRALTLIAAEFEPRTWQAFWRATVEQQPTGVIAEELGMSLASVRQAKSRVLRRLRAELGDGP
jgi:RNA polymerase sigma-70 factor (ECF subfamily)